MTTQVKLTCDGCGEDINMTDRRVAITVQVTDQATLLNKMAGGDYHPDCAPEWTADYLREQEMMNSASN